MTRRYEPFEIRVDEQRGDCYPILAECQGASWSDTLPAELPLLTRQEIQQALGWLERGFLDRDYAKDFGRRLFQTLFTPKIQGGFRSAYERAAAQGGLRIVLKLPTALLDLPWELMYDEEGGHGFLARSVTAPLVRYFLGMPLPHHPPKEGPLRILIVTASPSGYPQVSTGQEEDALVKQVGKRRLNIGETARLAWQHLARTRSVRGLAQRLRRRNLVEIDILSHATRASLQKRMVAAANAGGGFHVVHFVGHGAVADSGGLLLLETEDGKGDPIPAEEFAELIDEPTVNLAVLNACQTAAAMSVFNSVAQATLRRGIPAVIGMQVPILDQAAVDFAREFYSAWAAGEPVESALAYARRLMSSATPGAAADWGIPILHMGPTEGLSLQMPVPPLLWPRQILALIGLLVFTVIPAFYGFYINFIPRGPTEMNGTFNVVVADLGEQRADGQPLQYSEDGRQASDYIYRFLETNLKKNPELDPPMVERQRLNGFIPGATSAERASAARELAERVHATVIIYGWLDKRAESSYWLMPEFYVADTFHGAEELAREEAFGKPIELHSPWSDPYNLMTTASEFQPRVSAWTRFTLGLAYWEINQPDKALEFFTDAENISNAWSSGPQGGLEVLYLFEGAAYVKRNDPDTAEKLYQKALDKTGQELARAYLALGNISLQRIQKQINSKGPVESTLVNKAIAQYTRALDAKIKPETAYVDVKAYSNLGVAYSYKALFPGPCPNADAVQALGRPVAAYEKERSVELLQQLAAQGYYLLGRLYERCGDQRKREGKSGEAAQLYVQAAAQYDESIKIARPKTVQRPGWLGLPVGAPPPTLVERDWQRLRWMASHQLAYTYFTRGEMGERELYGKARDLYKEIVDEYEKLVPRGGTAIADSLAAEAYYNMGLALENLGENDAAMRAYRGVLQIKSVEKSPLWDRAQARLRALGQE